MAALSIITDLSPGWSKHNGHWVENVQSLSRSTSNDSMIPSLDVVDSNVLMNILSILRNIDSKMEFQEKRLKILETFPTNLDTNSGSGDITPLSEPSLSRGQTVRTSLSVERTATEIEDNEEIACASSLHKLEEFLDRAISIQGNGDFERVSILDKSPRQDCAASSTWADLLYPQAPEADGYSLSNYSGDVLTASKVNVTLSQRVNQISIPPTQHNSPLPPLPRSEVEEEMAQSVISKQLETLNSMSEFQATDERSTNSDTGEVNPAMEVPIPPQSFRKGISISITKVKTEPSYIKIEFAFYVPDNWKLGIITKVKSCSQELYRQSKTQVSRAARQAKEKVYKGFTKLRSKLKNETSKKHKGKGESEQYQTAIRKDLRIFNWRIVISLRNDSAA
ncbi:hypothetical protein F5884DRAFT_759196 [Xylogone sp. PMI_703]|nr:hypothetical protein F5884DRAFT_759196 [Xylogone sp. PMI_703]